MSDPIIRPIRSEDFQDHFELRTQPNVIWGTLQIPTLPRDVVQMQSGAQVGNYVFAAEVDGKMVGSVGLHAGPPNPRARHVMGLGMSVHDAYQGRGLGKRLMAAALDLADNYLGIERVELEVYTDNLRAIKLYEQFGFEHEGIGRSNAFRDGAYADSICMGRLRGRAAAAPRTAVPGALQLSVKADPPDGLTVRAVRPEDADAIYAIMLQPSVLAHLNRHSALHPDEIRKECKGLVWGQHFAVAEAAGKVVGAAYMSQSRPGRRGFVGMLDWIAVDQAWQGRSVGTALTKFLVNLADRWLNLGRLELSVPGDDAAGLALARKFGFVTEAVSRAAFFRSGHFVDVCQMGRVGKL